MEPIVALEVLAVEPAHDEVEVLGIGTVIIGLIPALSISVEPSGIVPPFSVALEVVPGFTSGEAVPVEVTFVADEQAKPPPSNVEFVPDIVEDPLGPDIPEDEDPPELQVETGAGLKPPGSISVAPSGMPVPELDPVDEFVPSIPSGEVAPIPDVPVTLWACAGPVPSRAAAVMSTKKRMELLLG